MLGKMVLDNSLLIAYENNKESKKFKLLMRKFSHPYATNWKQIKAALKEGLELPNHIQILSQMAGLPEFDDDLVTLASKTTFKIILTEDSSKKFPFVHFKNNMVNKNIVFSLSSTDSRQDLLCYLQMMCGNATKITICDNYFSENWADNSKLFFRVFPRKTLHIEYAEIASGINARANNLEITNAFLHTICGDWTSSVSTHLKYLNCHDRYLLIESPESKIEVMLSSGFHHLWKANPKEITCVFTEILA